MEDGVRRDFERRQMEVYQVGRKRLSKKMQSIPKRSRAVDFAMKINLGFYVQVFCIVCGFVFFSKCSPVVLVITFYSLSRGTVETASVKTLIFPQRFSMEGCPTRV